MGYTWWLFCDTSDSCYVSFGYLESQLLTFWDGQDGFDCQSNLKDLNPQSLQKDLIIQSNQKTEGFWIFSIT